jgi:hypothetical protein
MYSFQNGCKTPAFPVEPWANVTDDFVAWEVLLQVSDLSFEVPLLVVWADSGVADLDLLGGFLSSLIVSKHPVDVSNSIESFATRSPGDGHFSGGGLSLKCFDRDIICLLNFARAYVGCMSICARQKVDEDEEWDNKTKAKLTIKNLREVSGIPESDKSKNV